MKSGIYQIVNKIDQRKYIGSSKCIKERWRRHKKDLRKGKHHSQFLQRAWDKYGEENFSFEILEHCLFEQLCDRENYYLSKFRPAFNMYPEAYSQKGRKLSDTHIAILKKYAKENNVRPPESTWKDRQRAVDMLDKSTEEFIQTFESISAACRFIGRDSTFATTISDVCNGGKRRLSAFGYKWKWSNSQTKTVATAGY